MATINCGRCSRPIETDMAPQGTVSFCGECAPIVRPGLYADPAPVDIVELVWELVSSFHGYGPIVNDLSLCLGPFVWRDLIKSHDPRLYHDHNSDLFLFMGMSIYEVFDAGSHAVYVRLGQPSRKSRRLPD